MNRSNEAKLAQLAAYTLEMRAKAIREGAADPAVEDLAEVVKSRYFGDLDAATRSLVEELARRVQGAKDASRAARERLQKAWNSPAIKEMWRHHDALLAEAGAYKRRVELAEKGLQAKIAHLRAQGFNDAQIDSVLDLEPADDDHQKRHADLLAEADALRAEIEQHATVLAEGSAP